MSKDNKNIIILKKRVFKNKDALNCKHLERELKNKLREAKVAHRHKLEETFREKYPKRLWNNMKKMTGLS